MKMTGMQAGDKYGTGQYEIEDTSDIIGNSVSMCAHVCPLYNNNFPEIKELCSVGNFSSKTVEQFKDISNCNGAIETLSLLSDVLKQRVI